MFRKFLLLLPFIFSLFGCGPDDFEYEASLALPITNGTQTSGYPSVGYFTSDGVSCTATLIAPNALLTAKHCIKSSSGGFRIGGATKSWNKAYTHGSSDTAVAILTSNSSVTPSPLQSSAPSVGTRITLVGYGYTSNGGGNSAGNKYVGYNTISALNSLELHYRTGSSVSTICNGDSGGPSFIGSAVAGVHSWGYGSGYCSDPLAADMRVDAIVAWIRQVANINPPPPPPPPPPPSGNNTLTPNKYMYQNSYLQSSNGQWRFYVQDDGNLVLRAWPGTTVRWASGTNGKGGTKLILQQSDGNLVLYTSSNSPVWASNTVNKGAVRLTITDNGTLALYNSSGGAVWSKPGSSNDMNEENPDEYVAPEENTEDTGDTEIPDDIHQNEELK